MKLAVISDTHDNIKNLETAIAKINKSGAEILLHCGDLCSPFVIESLTLFNGPVHIVFGNNEGDRFTIEKVASNFSNITLLRSIMMTGNWTFTGIRKVVILGVCGF
jgi:putative phosphoesterase